MDWNGDDKKDLITGERDGYIRIYLNTGSDEAPVFSGYTFLLVDGLIFDCGLSSIPDVVDWNNDGLFDLLCGEDDGKVYLLLNSGKSKDPLFESAAFIRKGGGDLDVGSLASPTAVDWNRDGKKDLIVGELSGYLNYLENVGTDEEPLFVSSSLLRIDGVTIDVSYDAHPDAVDWDNDGVIDLVCGCREIIDGKVLYFHSRGPLWVNGNTLSKSSGGDIDFALNGGGGNAGRYYFLMGTNEGTEPGYTLPGGAILPLNWSWVSTYIFNNYNTYPLTRFRGSFDILGKATASLHVSSPPLAVGTILHFAFTTEMPYDYQSNPVSIEMLP